MKRLSQTTSFFLIAFSVLIAISSLKVGVGSPQAPGPGFMGFLASLLLLSLSLIVFVKESLRSAQEQGKGPLGWGSVTKQFIITIALCVYAFFLEILGFLVSSFILMWIMFLVESPRKWFTHMLVALIVANVSYLVLFKLLRVVLPAGIFRIGW